MNFKSQLIWSITIIIFFELSACNQQGATDDSWYRSPPEGNPLWHWEGEKIPQTHIHIVIKSKKQETEKLLENISILEITIQQATEFIGKPLPEIVGIKPYLVRGVYYGDDIKTGRFSAYLLHNQLRIHYGALGDWKPAMQRQVLVIQLERMPSVVFITLSMAR